MALLIGLFAALAAGGVPAPPAPRPGGARVDVPHFDVQEHRFANGLLLLTLEDHSAPIVTFQAFFAVGSADERSGATGSAYFLEHLMFDGAAKYGPKEFDRRLEQAGGTSSAVTTLDMTAFHEEFPPEALDLAARDHEEALARQVLYSRLFAAFFGSVPGHGRCDPLRHADIGHVPNGRPPEVVPEHTRAVSLLARLRQRLSVALAALSE